MTAYRIEIDQSLCSGFGTCVETASAAFALEGGVASARVRVSDDPTVLEAAAGCPMGAIAVYDGATGEQLA